jgi:putative membrane protein
VIRLYEIAKMPHYAFGSNAPYALMHSFIKSLRLNQHRFILVLVTNKPKMPIKNFRDHAANERTFLAWIRTAIAIMAFGFLVERFDLFLETVAPSLSDRVLSPLGHRFGNIAGLALIIAGTAMVALAMARFIKNAKAIDSDDETGLTASKLDVALASLLILLGLSMFLYLSHAFIPAS